MAPTKDKFIGKLVDVYTLQEKLGEGGFGAVYKAHQLGQPSGPWVAIKLFLDTNNSAVAEQYRREAHMLEQLHEPGRAQETPHHILRMLGSGKHPTSGYPYLILEYAPNGSLRDRLERQSVQLLPIKEALLILSQVGQALSYAHQKSIVHRDLKPENILFSRNNDVLLADFGLAMELKNTQSTPLEGTLAYIAPEQWEGKTSAKSDQYALACIAYELFTGKPLFTGDKMALMKQHLNTQPIPPRHINPTLPVHMEHAILKALAKERTERFETVAAFLDALTKAEKSAEQWLAEGNTHYGRRQYEQALSAYEQAVLLDPPPAQQAQMYAWKGHALSALQRYTEALGDYETAVQLDPTYARAMLYQGNALYALGKYTEALLVYDQAIALAPYESSAFVNKGNTLQKLQRYTEALLAYDQATRFALSPAYAYFCKGHVYVLLQESANAVRAFQYALGLANERPYQDALPVGAGMVSGAELSQVLRDLEQLDDTLSATGGTLLADAYRVRTQALELLQQQTKTDSEQGTRIIQTSLLPFLCRETDTLTPPAAYAVSQSRTLLKAWMGQYPSPAREVVVNAVLTYLLPLLHTSLLRIACLVIVEVGYRRDDLVETLWERADHAGDADAADTALASLAALGLPTAERLRLLATLHERVQQRLTGSVLFALHRLADPLSLDVISPEWFASAPASLGQSWALSLLGAIADANSADPTVQQRTWQTLQQIIQGNPGRFAFALGGESNLVSCIDSQEVVPYLFDQIGSRTNLTERQVLGLRLAECVRPQQLLGWEQAVHPQALALLQADACRDTAYSGSHQTEEGLAKKQAWQTLLLQGCPAVLTWFEQGVARETNHCVQAELVTLLACFRLDPLPPTVLQLIQEPYALQEEKRTGDVAFRQATLLLAQSTPSWEAFQALCHCGLSLTNENIPIGVDALSEVAAALLQEGNSAVLPALLTLAATPVGQGDSEAVERSHRRAAGVLEYLAVQGLLPPSFWQQQEPLLLALLADEQRTSFERSTYVRLVGCLPGGDLPPALLQQVREWAQAPPSMTRDLRWSALEALARWGFLLTDPVLLREQLGCYEQEAAADAQEEACWDITVSAQRPELAEEVVSIIALLYLTAPQRLAPALATLLRTQQKAVHLVGLLMRLQHSTPARSALPEQAILPTAVAQALLERVRRWQDGRFATAREDFFTLAAFFLPEAFIQERWEAQWETWPEAARTRFAEALGDRAFSSSTGERSQESDAEATHRTLSLLLLLLRDGDYAVRRAAARSLARQSLLTLVATCLAWVQAPAAPLRQRAAEAWGWLEAEQADPATEWLAQVRTTLAAYFAADTDPLVRESFTRAWRDARQRQWAASYSKEVLDREDPAQQTNLAILCAWRYKHALTQVGDDATLARLRAASRNGAYLPHTRQWLAQLSTALETQWKKTQEAWPSSWLPWEGELEAGRGEFILSDDTRVPVHYVRWRAGSGSTTGTETPGIWQGGLVCSNQVVRKWLPTYGLLEQQNKEQRLLLQNICPLGNSGGGTFSVPS